MKESIQFITLWRSEINRFRDKIIKFLLDLDEEKETLFGREIARASNDEYSKVCNQSVNKSICIVLALSRNRIIGLTGLIAERYIVGDVWPFLSSYTVVNRDFQGKRIGTRLWMKRQEDTCGRFAFIFSGTKRDNIPARRIDAKFDFKIIYEDETSVYSVKPCTKVLIIFVPLIRLAFHFYIKFTRELSFQFNF